MRNFLILFLISQFLVAAQWPERSVYHLDGKWKDHSGSEQQLSQLAGQPVVVAMVFTSCQHACPMITQKIKDIRNGLPDKLQNKAKYALISFDPERDTPAVLAAYKKKHRLDENWVLLTSTELEARKLAGVLGVNYKKTEGGDFSHSNIVTLLDKKGVIVSKIERLNQDNTELVRDLKKLLQ